MSRTIVIALLSALLLATAAPAQYESLKAQAEKEYAEKSFQRAHDVYAEAAKLPLSEEEKRWVAFRLAETTLRADLASPANDPTARDAARRALENIIRDEPHDRVWAEANETLADLQGATQYYVSALDWWAGQDDLALARARYLAIVWKLTPGDQPWNAPRQVLVNAVKIAETPSDRAHARFLLAEQLEQEGRPASIERALDLYDEIISLGTKTQWYDDALYHAASAHMGQGRYTRALELLQRILSEFKAGETSYYDGAKGLIADITRPTVHVQAPGTFLPDVEQRVMLAWRNVKQIELALYSVDLTKDADFDRNRNWIDTVQTAGREVVRKWTHDTNDTGEHVPNSIDLPLTPKLPMGAYVLTARAGEASSRTLVLVTDAHILLHSGRERASIFVSHVLTGEPIANARVRIIRNVGRDRIEKTAQTNANGLAEVSTADGGTVLITAAAGARQAYHQTWMYNYTAAAAQQWRVYAFTDRPAYRPDETVQWKIFARTRDKETWVTPSGASLAYEITSPRGEKIAMGTAKLNDFGSFWSELALTSSMPLGAYSITFRNGDRYVGSAQLFRLEEYKLPEFVVRVSTAEGQQYRLGDTIEATIDASYYFGGPVANAEVEVVVYQSPFQRYWYPWREYDWYWRGWIAPPPPESIVTTEDLRTDANGRAVVHIDTQRDGPDMQYRIEARVVDASRREVRGEGSVRVMKQRYSVLASPAHMLHRPGETVSVKFKAMDANDKPVQTPGTVEVKQRRWRADIIRGGRYEDEPVLTTKLTTNDAGEATLTFMPKTTGYYVVRWTSVDGDAKRAQDLVIAETTIWVTDRATNEIGYHTNGSLELIVDKESVRVGDTASVMVVTPASGRWVVFSTFGDDILDTQVLHLDGTVKLVQIPVVDAHVPNFFVTASSIFNRQLATDTERIVVPPVEHFLTVDVTPDREQYEPRQAGAFTVTTRDAAGNPVPAEVAVSVTDEAVTAIQQDTSGDPRQFFFGDVRETRMQVSASVQSQRYISRDDEERVREEDKRRRDAAYGYGARMEGGVEGGVVGGVVGGLMATDAVARNMTVTAQAPMVEPAMAPPPPAPVAPQMMKEAGAAANAEPAVQVRSDFRSTAFWKPDVITDASGKATIKVSFPEALTTWRAVARAATKGSSFGIASSTARTNLPLIVRLQAPRFFVVGDRATVSAVVNNNTDVAMTVKPSLDVEGLTVRGTSASLEVPARGEARADWTVVAEKAGNAKLRVTGRSSTHADAMEKSFVVYEHGIDKLIARSGKLRGDEALIRLELPRERRATDLTVSVQPSLAIALVDALPYLIEFPYGCTEQTMSRFLPAAIVARTLDKLNLDRSVIAGKNLDAVTAAGMARLYDMQHGDGGWGWWKGGNSDDFMTAYVVWGFAIARDGGLDVNERAVERAMQYLDRRLVSNENNWSMQTWMLHAMSAWGAKATTAKPTTAQRRAFDDVWEQREHLSAYSRALLALTAHRYGDAERARVLVRNLEDGVKIDDAPDRSVVIGNSASSDALPIAYWGASGFWWRWQEGPIETTSFVLQALVNIQPDHRLIEPAMNWLIKNRRGAQWSNTRDTAIAVLSLNDYLKVTGELRNAITYEVSVNG
ncbi:MAG TPA: MG2 domain-containing protein, partial [Thermoanaerobaculia bacterium]|nr:MG2 domain-containing protein [Thermoanaerobaculia bacterium]